jgi:alkanesulfonate monooxygenase SsuD/methylene tetrahydromethanopterin reductase-like flavin-dependent oxidoreductase (luciferase family)
MPDTHFGPYDQTTPPTGPEVADAMDHCLAESEIAERVGFDGLWVPERHQRPETWWPNTITQMAAIAARTKKVDIACTVIQPTFHHPVHLAEQLAQIDCLSRGRLTFGAGVGALAMKPLAPRIVRGFGFRRVLLANAALSSLLVALPGLFRPDWAAWALFGALMAGGFARSLQFTTVNALLYADVPREDLSRATTFGSVMQELAGTFGVATAALALAAMQDLRGREGLDALDFPLVFALVGAISLASALPFLRLSADAGRDLARRGGG